MKGDSSLQSRSLVQEVEHSNNGEEEMTNKTVGVVLAGCGFLDGAEIHEATLTLLALDRAGVTVRCMAPNTQQMHVVNHRTSTPREGSSRNVLEESARIARCEISDMAEVSSKDLDALIFPGGFGAAKNLCTYALDGPNCSVHPEVARLIEETYAENKPLGFICIAPVLGAKVLGKHGISLTIGTDAGTGKDIEAMGATHIPSPVENTVVDEEHRVVSTPAYMLGPSIAPVAQGIDKLVAQVLAWIA